ncbi:MAG TPA: histidine phosphatase family protein [Polyangiales bacterium]|nr:histidine phosphatase family protein [Polyangiales bacterium]
MGRLLLIRHGQAAAFSEDSDRLTELGERQARVLGEYLVAQRLPVDAVIRGSLRRHAQTEAGVAAAYQGAGHAWPAAVERPEWNEYDAGAILSVLGASLRERDAGFAQLAAEFQAAFEGPERNRYFQRMFETLMARWVSGDLLAEGVESFAIFHERVVRGLVQVLEERGTVAVFTSGGPIGVCVQHCLKAPGSSAVELNWRVKNGSITEFAFGKGRLSLDMFNGTSHFSDPKLLSFR